jgi:hypothetical protein
MMGASSRMYANVILVKRAKTTFCMHMHRITWHQYELALPQHLGTAGGHKHKSRMTWGFPGACWGSESSLA